MGGTVCAASVSGLDTGTGSSATVPTGSSATGHTGSSVTVHTGSSATGSGPGADTWTAGRGPGAVNSRWSTGADGSPAARSTAHILTWLAERTGLPMSCSAAARTSKVRRFVQ